MRRKNPNYGCPKFRPEIALRSCLSHRVGDGAERRTFETDERLVFGKHPRVLARHPWRQLLGCHGRTVRARPDARGDKVIQQAGQCVRKWAHGASVGFMITGRWLIPAGQSVSFIRRIGETVWKGGRAIGVVFPVFDSHGISGSARWSASNSGLVVGGMRRRRGDAGRAVAIARAAGRSRKADALFTAPLSRRARNPVGPRFSARRRDSTARTPDAGSIPPRAPDIDSCRGPGR